MITKISIENFKGIGDRVEVPLRPITLLFGANSAGKSTILHALHYAREILLRHNLDAAKTESGGDMVDLGGFHNFVHHHDLNRTIRLRFEFRVPELYSCDITEFLHEEDYSFVLRHGEEEYNFSEQKEDYHLTFLGGECFAVELAVSWSTLEHKPYVSEYKLEIADLSDEHEQFAKIVYEPGKPEPLLCDINYKNRAFQLGIYDSNSDSVDHINDFNLAEYLLMEIYGEYDREKFAQPISLDRQTDALPAKELWISDDSWPDEKNGQSYEKKRAISILTSLFTNYFELSRKELVRVLDNLCYIGPVRECPPRNYSYPRQVNRQKWPTGLAAWDTLYLHGDETISHPESKIQYSLMDEVSKWLKRMGTGYVLACDEIIELNTTEPLYLSLIRGDIIDFDTDDVKATISNLPKDKRIYLIDPLTEIRYLANDVGQGISQIFPIVVAVLAGNRGLFAVEQPELHVHPAIQANLGDLFIYRCHLFAPFSNFVSLIETHSEHLILRLLRRIRETQEKTLPSDELSLTTKDISVIYVENKDGNMRATPLRVDERGEFLDPWPNGFFEERAEELF